MLLLASLACVVVLTASLATGSGAALRIGNIPAGTLALAGIRRHHRAGCDLSCWSGRCGPCAAIRKQPRPRHASFAARFRPRQALIKAEPQVLMHWEPGKGLSGGLQYADRRAGPARQSQWSCMRFGFWLDRSRPRPSRRRSTCCSRKARSFNIILKTSAGGHVEADGRAAGGRAVLRLRDVAGYKRDLTAILDQHTRLARDVRSSRALSECACLTRFGCAIRTDDLSWVNAAYVKAVDAENEREVVDGQIELLEIAPAQEHRQSAEGGPSLHGAHAARDRLRSGSRTR